MTRALVVWLIDEGHPGHRAQSLGLVAALERLGRAIELLPIAASTRLPGMLRPPARRAFDHGPPALARWLTRRVSGLSRPEGSAPGLIVSSGGRSVFANALLARETGAANLFIGDPRPYPPAWFRAVLSPVPVPDAPNVAEVVVLPTTISAEGCAVAARERWPEGPPAPVWALLAGGDSRSHRFDATDWRELAAGADALARAHGIRWLIATSRRSGPVAERTLRTHLDPGAVAEAALFGERPEPVIRAYLGAAEAIFVTQDSLTMLSEALVLERPLTALAPRRVRLVAGSLMATMLARFERLEGFARRPIAALGAGPPPTLARARGVLEHLDLTIARTLDRIGV